MEIDDDVELIKQKVLKEIKPINFEDELNIDDILGQELVDQINQILPHDPLPPESIPVAVQSVKSVEITPKKLVEDTVCEVCLKSFTNSRNLRKHFAKHTGRFFCSVCKKIFARKDTQLKHIARCKNKIINDQIEKRRKKPFKDNESCKYYCKECNKSFTRRENYDHHIKVHEGIQVICDFCQKRLSSFKSYQRHKKLHEYPQQKIACEDCPSKFSLKSNLQRHIKLRKHKNEKICIKCNTNVKTENNLQKHRFQDTISSCSLCSQLFCFEADLRSHLKKDHPNLWFKCKRCPNTPFMTRSTKNLQGHAKKLHSIHLDSEECFQEGWFMVLPN